MATVRLENLTKKYGENTVLDGISLEIPEGTLVSLLGPSGCGKTTTLRLIAGFEQADGGDIYIDNQRVNDIKVHQRNIGMVFQSYALFPHMTVWDNVAYGLKQRKLSKKEIDSRVKDVLKLVQLEGYEARKPKQLSGGQQQRVALARALVIQPKILLLDESLSALDKKLRVEMQVELRRILDASGITALFVTHDQEEALTLSDYIVVMDRGTIVQVGKPYEVYEAPKNRFVASFLGKSNFFEGVIKEKNDIVIILETSFGEMPLATSSPREVGEAALYSIRPEKIKLEATDKNSAAESISGVVKFVTYAGNISSYTIDCNGLQVIAESQNAVGEFQFKEGDLVFLCWEPQFCLLMEDEVKK
ncbi:MAG TPA: ABC transporter ATP-binding protein [Clostridiales bacterium]|nr:ABC transporter ATP-binding protein [Clostridiales bacterium]